MRISFYIILFLFMIAGFAWAGDPFAGSAIYADHCVSCHGGDGSGEVAGTPSFRGGALMSKGEFELRDRVRTGKDLMPGFGGILTEEQIDDVVTYIRTFN
jgi:mono/diheme cytochrome c family protein